MTWTDTAVVECEEHPVRSRAHTPEDGFVASDYNSLPARGRTLYDNLRTKFDWSHEDAYSVALHEHGYRNGHGQ